MADDDNVAEHYTRGGLLDALNQRLREDGVDPDHPSLQDLAPYDHFHGRGMEATDELAEMLDIAPEDHVLDVGSGIGGPARYMADRFGCHVTGIDLTHEFCDVAHHLTRLLGLQDKITIEHGNALSMPFRDASFDGAYSMNVSMNIADKAAFYAELHRVLKPGAWLMLSEIAQGSGGQVEFPTPWARSAETSHLSTPEATREGLAAAGFEIRNMRDTAAEGLAFGARSRAMVERGEKPPHRAVQLIHGDIAPAAMANSGNAMKSKSVVPIEILSVRQA